MSTRGWSQGAQARGVAVGLPPVLQRPPVPVRARHTPGSLITVYGLRPVWLWRRELGAVAVVAGVGGWAEMVAGWPVLVLLAVAGGALVSGRPGLRAWMVRVWGRARVRRQWDRACRFAGLQNNVDRIPRLRADRVVPAGVRVEAWLPKGGQAEDVAAAAERIASCMRVREVRVVRDVARAHVANVEIVRRDPFLPSGDARDYVAAPWPWRDRTRADLWEPVPVGVDEMGSTVTLSLAERSLLLGGEPGAGKSAALSNVIAAAALDPSVELWGLDAKRLELGLWRPVMARVGYTIEDAIAMFRDLVEVMEERYIALEEAGLRKVRPYEGPIYVVPIDELRFFTAHANRKARAEFNDLAVDLAARGRAAGIIPLPATQKPSGDVVPTSLRDLLAYRWAMRCSTRDASDTILGAGWASNGFSAATIDDRTPGVGFLLAEGGQPRRVRSFYLSDNEITSIAARGAVLRAERRNAA